MEEYLNTSIKEIIEKYREVEEILNDYDIGCTACSVANCLLKDVVEIHDLGPEDERRLLERIAEVLYPGQKVSIPRIERKAKAGEERKLSPPTRKSKPLRNTGRLCFFPGLRKWTAILGIYRRNRWILSRESKKSLIEPRRLRPGFR